MCPVGAREGVGGATLWLEDDPAASRTLALFHIESEGDEVEARDKSEISITKYLQKVVRDINRIYNYNNIEAVVVNIHYPL